MRSIGGILKVGEAGGGVIWRLKSEDEDANNENNEE